VVNCARCGTVNVLDLQSEEQTDTSVAPEASMQQQMAFRDAAVSNRITYGSISDSSYDHDKDPAAGLGAYLSRPVLIHTFLWEEGVFANDTFKPWTAYFSNSYIQKKLDHYARLHCQLRLKFVINSSPFYYGALRACYVPLNNPIAFNTASDQIPLSQTPGLYLEPQSMSAAEMTLPFLWPNTWLDVNQESEFDDMGTMHLVEYAGLQSANGVVGTGITVSVYAWAEDLTIAGPTTGLALQSDEYEEKEGTISGPATAIAGIASMLSSAPFIGPYAMATSIGASAVAGIAKLFGYSNPPMIDDVHAYQPKAFHALANVETRMPIDKLALDPKNEVSIANSLAGTDDSDSLSFENTIGRESFLSGAAWDGSQATNALIFSAMVTPMGYVTSGSASDSTNWFTPSSYFGSMFRFWRGSMIYKMKFIKSQYHKGRLVVSWDPNADISGITGAEAAVFTRVVDLEFEDEVEIEIPYKAVSPYLKADLVPSCWTNSATPSYSYDNDAVNGMFTVRVQNVLTGPAASPNIVCLFYARPGKDIMFSAPKDLGRNYSPLPLQSDEQDDIVGGSVSIDTTIGVLTTGENVASLRPLLHRASFYCVQHFGQYLTGASTYVGPGFALTTNLFERLPRSYGWVSGATNWALESDAVTNSPFNFVANHPIDWVVNCFAGYRGSTNIHVNPISTGSNVRLVDSVSVTRYYDSIIPYPNDQNRNRFTVRENNGTSSSIARATVTSQGGVPRYISGQSGTSMTNTRTQAAVSVNVPQYSQFRFQPAFIDGRNTVSGNTLEDNVAITAAFDVSDAGGATTQWPMFSLYYSAGVDFNCVFFVCTPVIYGIGAPTAVNDFNP